MIKTNIYLPVWKKYKPAILNMMKESTNEITEYQLSRHEFESIGDRPKAGFSFKLVIKNGKFINNIDGTAVARDLFIVLNESKTARSLFNLYCYQINLTNDFKLLIQILK
jgi:hypothetical protein